jgi:DNA polymerase delta subunit 1
MVSEKYTRANGYEADCEVIYGDTDSVMVHFKVPDTARAMELGKDAADYVSATFVKPINLEFEKVHSIVKKKKKKNLACSCRHTCPSRAICICITWFGT